MFALMVILFIVAFICCLAAGGAFAGNTTEAGLGGFLLMVVSLCCFLTVIALSTERNYRNGQIHALTGDVRYRLVTHPDGTRTWEAGAPATQPVEAERD